jgi:uncharacterized protein YyaL (SSP411 family)
MNRLADETSPYLLQHADNPVDWYPWGEEAFQKAQAENKPILLSVGYSACHWCHVMAHESFEHAPTADMMNQSFVNIKVDREERPDVDDIYMQAVQALSRGRGGWPMTAFLLPDGRPFYGGTYFPREPRYGIPSFRQIMQGVLDAYNNRRADVEQVASQLTRGMSRTSLGIGNAAQLDAELLGIAYERLANDFDSTYGGFGDAPKFPQPMNLEFLLRYYARTGDARALEIVTFTLKRMATGGIYDQIGGGFHRYSVDSIWLVPHFEKMLYDNAQLSRVYLHAWQITGNRFFLRIAEEIYNYILNEMTSFEGGFYSTTDADSEGEEGKFFVWSKDDLLDLLGNDADIAVEYWGVSSRGNFEGRNILFVPNEDHVVAQRLGLSVDELAEKIEGMRDILYAVRSQRVAPGLDDKVIAAWNGMMLASLSEAARVLKRDDYMAAALRNAAFLREKLITEDGRVLRTYKYGATKQGNGYLEDYAHLIDAFLELYQTTFDERWFVEAQQLADVALARFRAEDGGFYDTSDDHEKLIARPRSLQDNATPSGSTMMAKGLIRLSAYTGDADYDEAARRTLGMLYAAMREYPQAFGEALSAVDMLVHGIDEIAIVGELSDSRTSALLETVQRPYRPNVVAAVAPYDVRDEHIIALLSQRTQVNHQPTVYVCRHFACQMPVTTPAEVEKLLEPVAEG